MGSFYREKAIYAGKKVRKMTLLPLKIFPLQRNKIMTHGEGPESMLSMGPERPRYATATSTQTYWNSDCEILLFVKTVDGGAE